MTYNDILNQLTSKAVLKTKEGMARFGIVSENALGVNIPDIRRIAAVVHKAYKNQEAQQHALGLMLYQSQIHEAKILGAYIAIPEMLTEAEMDAWAENFYSWDVCDQVCGNLFDKTVFARQKATVWCIQEKEFVKRAGFVLMATLAVHDKEAKDEVFIKFFPALFQEATDERNFVKKAINWAIRQIGKRNRYLHTQALELAQKILLLNSKGAKWIAKNALKELNDPQIIEAIQRKC